MDNRNKQDVRESTTPGRDANRDPITGEPGSHPIGTGLGAVAAGAAAGAAGGAIGGPVGAAAGAVIGGVAGGLAGKAVGEAVNPTVEDEYWRKSYSSRPYVDKSMSYDDYGPAYRYGWESHRAHKGGTFEACETDLGRGWDEAKGKSRLSWDRAKEATRDAWHRIEKAIPGDADKDGY
jgi:hypothetical protein